MICRKASRWPKIVRHLVDGPKTVSQLEELTGAQDAAVRRCVALLEDEGVIVHDGFQKRADRGGYGAKVWRWV